MQTVQSELKIQNCTKISISRFPGMNVNQRELCQHVEFETQNYYAAFTTELEASAHAMWQMVSHIRDQKTLALGKKVLRFCLTALQDWFEAINFTRPEMVHPVIETFDIRIFNSRVESIFPPKMESI